MAARAADLIGRMENKYTLLLITSTACMLSCTNPPDQIEAAIAVPDPLVARIDSFMQANVAAGFNGSLLVIRDGKTLIDTGYGLRDREQKLPNTSATVHAIGSITKQFTAACILKLQEMGKLKVTDPMSNYLENVPVDKSGITLHHLLTHSAGFLGAIGDDQEAINGADFTKLALATPLKFAPGSGYEYSNVGYSLLGIIVEIVSGGAYERFLHDELLVPAGLTHTGYRMPDWSKEDLAIGYRKDGTRWGTMLDQPTVNGGPGWHLRANGGILSTTHDMAGWVDALVMHKVLDSTSVASMFAPHVEEGEGAGSHYGYGWAIFSTPRNTRLITHNGGNGVQFADVLFYADEGVTVVLMSNASVRGMQDVAWQVGRMMFDPTFKPEVVQPTQALEGVPNGPAGDRMKALSAIIASDGDDATLTTWLQENLGPGFLQDMPIERHVSMFKRMRADIGANTIEAVEQIGPEEFALKLRSVKSKALFRVMLQLRPSDARIGGMGVEKVE
jgi:CubicO group peptidase (beta-lactamase class C family)